MVGVRIIPHLWEKKQEKKKKVSQLESSSYKEIQKCQPFCCTWSPYVFFKSKATTPGRI